MTIINAAPATVWSVVKAAAPGDLVQLAAGDYGALSLYNMTKSAPGVTIQPAPGALARLSAINVDGSSGLTFKGFEVLMTPSTQYGLTAGNAANVTFDGLKVRQGDGTSLVGVCAFFRNASYISLVNSELCFAGVGCSVMDCSHVQIAGNQIHDVNVDAVDIAGSSSSTISGNQIRDLRPGAGDHPDAIQLWATADHPTPTGNVVIGNTYERGAGDVSSAAQGIFLEDQTGIVVRDNVLRGTMTNGIALSRCRKAEVSGNFVQGRPDMGARIIVRGASSEVSIRDNAANSVSDYAAEGGNVNLTVVNTTIIPQAPASDTTAFAAWSKTGAGPVTTPPVTDPQAAQIASLSQQLAASQAAFAASQAQADSLAKILAQVAKLAAVVAA